MDRKEVVMERMMVVELPLFRHGGKTRGDTTLLPDLSRMAFHLPPRSIWELAFLRYTTADICFISHLVLTNLQCGIFD